MPGTIKTKKRIKVNVVNAVKQVGKMDTGYYIEHSIIWGPKHSGEYWINGNRIIWGPKNPGKYCLDEDRRVRGPNTNGEFYIQNNRIYGPNANVPWMR